MLRWTDSESAGTVVQQAQCMLGGLQLHVLSPEGCVQLLKAVLVQV